MKLSEEIRSRPTKKGNWDSDIIADKVAQLEERNEKLSNALAERIIRNGIKEDEDGNN